MKPSSSLSLDAYPSAAPSLHRHREPQPTPFILEGYFLGMTSNGGKKLKYLGLGTGAANYVIKLPKELRPSLMRELVAGNYIRVTGQQTVQPEDGELMLSAQQVLVLNHDSIPLGTGGGFLATPMAATPATAVAPTTSTCDSLPKLKILVCQKSDCWKQGGKAICQAFRANLGEAGEWIDDQGQLRGYVQIQMTGCMKQCKRGPNLTVMPAKKRYSHVHPDAVRSLIEQHLTD